MVDLLNTGTAWLSSRLATGAATAGVYRRSETDESATLSFTRGRTDREQQNDRGLINVIGSDDLIVSTNLFREAFGIDAEPADGDVIELGGRQYRVRPLGSEASWSYAPYEHQIRIHVKDEGPVE